MARAPDSNRDAGDSEHTLLDWTAKNGSKFSAQLFSAILFFGQVS